MYCGQVELLDFELQGHSFLLVLIPLPARKSAGLVHEHWEGHSFPTHVPLPPQLLEKQFSVLPNPRLLLVAVSSFCLFCSIHVLQPE